MTVWYSSDSNEIISTRAHEEYLDNLAESYDTDDNFDSFLEENFSFNEVFGLTEYERDEVREDFVDWRYEQAKAEDIYTPYEVRLASYEVEE